MQDYVSIIQTVGFPIATALACGYFIYKLVTRDKDEAVNRETKSCEMISKLAEALDKSSEAIQDSTRVNSALAETNKLMATDIQVSLDKILDKVSCPNRQ
jgi:hypothetical protein